MINLYNTDFGIGVQDGTQYFRTWGNFAWFRQGSHNNAEFNAGGGTVDMVLKNGFLGIGTDAPTSPLMVSGTGATLMTLETTNTQRCTQIFKSGTTSEWQIGARGSSGNPDNAFYIYDSKAPAYRMVIASSGYVGIGTSAPRYKLVVGGTTGSDVSAAIVAGGEDKDATLYFGNPYINSDVAYKTAIIAEGVGSWSRAKLHFCLNDSSSSAEISSTTASITDSRMTILSNGNVGIGKNTPAYKLDLNGDFHLSHSASVYIQSQDLNLYTRAPNLDYRANQYFWRANDNGLTYAFLNSTGLSIGGQSPSAKLDVNGTAHIKGSTRIDGDLLIYNGTRQTSASITTGNGTFLSIEAFNSANTSDKKVVCLNAYGGNVAIGTTGAVEKLQVNGNILCNPQGFIGGRGSGGTTAYPTLYYYNLSHPYRCRILPGINVNGVGQLADNSVDLGAASHRFQDTYTKTIRTAYGTTGVHIIGSNNNNAYPTFYPSAPYYGYVGTSGNRFWAVYTQNIFVDGVQQHSDDRLKHNEEDVPDALSIINKLKLQLYDKTEEMLDANFNGDLGDIPNHKEFGFIAQEVSKISELDFLVSGGGTAMREVDNISVEVEVPFSLNYQGINNIAIQAIQELHALVKAQQKQIDELIAKA